MGNPDESGTAIINFASDRVGLGPMRRDLIPTYLRWINDIEVARFVGRVRPFSEDDETRWFDALIRDEDSIHFTIYEMTGPTPVGTIALHGINHANGTAELGIAIGDSTRHGQGFGTEAVRLICDYGFNALGLTNILLRLVDFNERALRAYTRAGFREIGRRRQCRAIGGRRVDDIYMDLIASEFESPILAERLTEPPRR